MASTSDNSLLGSAAKLNKTSNYYCCVPMCNSNGRYDFELSFHHIPKDENLRKKWIIKIRRDEGPMFRISKCTVVCSKHFTKDDYTEWAPVKKRLKKDAVPSVFDWTDGKTPRRALKRKLLATPKSEQSKRQRQQFEDSGFEETEVLTDIPLERSHEEEISELKDQLNQC